MLSKPGSYLHFKAKICLWHWILFVFKSKRVFVFFFSSSLSAPSSPAFLTVQYFSSSLITILTFLYFHNSYRKYFKADMQQKIACWSHNVLSPEWTVGGCRGRRFPKPQRAAKHAHARIKRQDKNDTYDLLNMWNIVQQNLFQTASRKRSPSAWVAFLTSGWSQCFPNYFWVSGNVAGASALWVTPHRSQRMSFATNTPLSTSHLKRQCTDLRRGCS